MNNILSEILFDASYLFIFTGSFVALIFGIGLFFFPAITLKFNNRINQRISLRKTTKKIETPIYTEKYFYRYAAVSGIILVLGSAFVLYTLATFDLSPLVKYLPKTLSPAAWGWLLEAGQLFFLISCVGIFIFGLVVLIRPSQLKNIEQIANRWISTRQQFHHMSNDIDAANVFIESNPRLAGCVIGLTAAIVMILLLPAL